MAQHFPIQAVCQVLGISRSGFYAHKKKPFRPRRSRDRALKPKIEDAFQESRQTYGSPRIVAELKSQGEPCGKNRVARLMRELCLWPRQKRRFRPKTTDSSKTLSPARNWLLELPEPDKPNQIWTSDITYIPTLEGWLYLAGHMDRFSRMIVGWAVSHSLETTLVERSLAKALSKRRLGPGLVHHSDRGSQYASHDYRQKLQEHRITPSMSRKANCYDNAGQESFWATLKAECMGDYIPQTRKEAELLIFSYIEGFYNTRRRHSALGYRSPEQYEHDYHTRSRAHQKPCPVLLEAPPARP